MMPTDKTLMAGCLVVLTCCLTGCRFTGCPEPPTTITEGTSHGLIDSRVSCCEYWEMVAGPHETFVGQLRPEAVNVLKAYAAQELLDYSNILDGVTRLQDELIAVAVPSRDKALFVGCNFFDVAVCFFRKIGDRWVLMDSKVYRAHSSGFEVFFIDADQDGNQDMIVNITNHPGTGIWYSVMHVLRIAPKRLEEVLSLSLGEASEISALPKPAVSLHRSGPHRVLEVRLVRVEASAKVMTFIWDGKKFVRASISVLPDTLFSNPSGSNEPTIPAGYDELK